MCPFNALDIQVSNLLIIFKFSCEDAAIQVLMVKSKSIHEH